MVWYNNIVCLKFGSRIYYPIIMLWGSLIIGLFVLVYSNKKNSCFHIQFKTLIYECMWSLWLYLPNKNISLYWCYDILAAVGDLNFLVGKFRHGLYGSYFFMLFQITFWEIISLLQLKTLPYIISSKTMIMSLLINVAVYTIRYAIDKFSVVLSMS